MLACGIDFEVGEKVVAGMANILAWFDLRMGYSFYPILGYFLKLIGQVIFRK